MRLSLASVAGAAVLGLAGTARACLYWEFDFAASYVTMNVGFNDDGVETCQGLDTVRDDRYFWFNCISGYRLEIDRDLNDAQKYYITYGTPHGVFDWTARTTNVVGTTLATGSMFC